MGIQRYNRISIVLDEFQMDQKDLATLLDVSKDTVSRWCRNENQPRLPELFNIAGVFRIDVCRLLEPADYRSLQGLSPAEVLKQEKSKTKERIKNSKKNPTNSKQRRKRVK